MKMDYETEEAVKGIFAILIIVGLVFCAKGCMGMVAKEEAKIYNAKFGTSYSEHEFFWTGSEIKKLIEEKVPERPKKYELDIK
jgi:hypothetical protein